MDKVNKTLKIVPVHISSRCSFVMKSYPLLELTLSRVLRTRRARGDSKPNRTLLAWWCEPTRLGALASLASKTKNLSIFRVPPPTPSRLKKEGKVFGFGSAFRLPKAPFQSLSYLRDFHFAFSASTPTREALTTSNASFASV